MALADQIFVMDQGTVQQAGDHRVLYEQPANLFVAGFIGTPAMNFLGDLRVSSEQETTWLSSAGQQLLPK